MIIVYYPLFYREYEIPALAESLVINQYQVEIHKVYVKVGDLLRSPIRCLSEASALHPYPKAWKTASSATFHLWLQSPCWIKCPQNPLLSNGWGKNPLSFGRKFGRVLLCIWWVWHQRKCCCQSLRLSIWLGKKGCRPGTEEPRREAPVAVDFAAKTLCGQENDEPLFRQKDKVH